MHLSSRIAWRYLKSRRKPGPVTLITWIAVGGIVLGTAALYIILSVFNGFSALLGEVFARFDPDIRISPAQGQYFVYDDSLLARIRSVPQVVAVVPTVRGRGLLRYHENQTVVELRGVPPDFTEVSRVTEAISHGNYDLRPTRKLPGIVAGGGVAYSINARLHDPHTPLELMCISPSARLIGGDPLQAINTQPLMLTGVFTLQKEYDDRVVVVDLALAQQLLEARGKASQLEVRLTDRKHLNTVMPVLAQLLGSEYVLADPWQQHETLYRVLQNEKRVGFLLIVLMLVLYCTNIVGSLSMIVLEKQRDIGILQVMGARRSFVRRIFLTTGLWVGVLGGGLGLVLGWGLSSLQARYHFVRFGTPGDNLIINHFPIETQMGDLIGVAVTVLALSLLSAWYPAHRAARASILQNLRGK